MPTTAAALDVQWSSSGQDKVKADIEGVGKEVEGASKKVGLFRGAMSMAGGFVAANVFMAAGEQVKNFVTGAITGASDLNESVSKTNVVFGQSAGQVQSWAKGASTSMGMTRQAALENVSTFGNMLTSMGFAQDGAAKMSEGMVGLAGDMASFNNASPEETFNAIQAATIGEYEPLRRYGVVMSEAEVQTRAMADTGKTNAKELTNQEKAMARYELIMEKTKVQQGDFARTSGGLANQQRILAAQWGDLKAKIGTALLPVVLLGVKGLNSLLGALMNINSINLGPFGGIVSSIGAGLSNLGKFLGMVISDGDGFNDWLTHMSPPLQAFARALAIPIEAIQRLAAAFREGGWRGALNELPNTVAHFADAFASAFTGVARLVTALGDRFHVLQSVTKPLSSAFYSLGLAAQHLGRMFADLMRGDWSGAWDQAKDAIRRLLMSWRDFETAIFSGIALIASGLQRGIGAAFDALAAKFPAFANTFNVLKAVFDNLLGVVKNLAQAFADLLQGDWGGFFSNLGQAGVAAMKLIFNAAMQLPTLLMDTFRAIDWGALGSWAVGMLAQGFSAAGGALGNLFQWLSDALMNALNDMGTALQVGLQLAWDQISSLNWGDFISTLVWDVFVAAVDLATYIGGKIADVAVWVWDKIKGFFPSASVIAGTIGDIASWLWGKIKGFFPSGSVITGTIGDLGSWLYKKLGSPHLSIPDWPGWSAFFDYIYQHTLGQGQSKTVNDNEKTKDQTGGRGDQTTGGAQPVPTGRAAAPDLGAHLGMVAALNAEMAAYAGVKAAAQAAEAAQGKFTSALSLMGTVAGAVLPGIATSALVGLAPVAPLITGVANAAVGVAVPAFNAILGGASIAFGLIPGVTQLNFGAMLGSVAANTAGAAVSAIGNTASLAGGVIGNTAIAAAGAAANTAGMAASVAGNAADMASSAIASAADANSGVTGEMIGMRASVAAQSAIAAAVAAAQGQSLANGLISGAQQAAFGVLGALSAIPGIVASIGGAAASIAFGIGANIGNSMAAGMYGALGAIQAAASAMVAAASVALMAKAMIGSPSKLFRRHGQNVGGSFALGQRDMIPTVRRATADLVGLPALGTPYRAAATAGISGGATTVNVGGIVIYQQPGEDGDALARRVLGALRDASARV